MLLLKITVSLLYTRLWIICFPTRRTLCVGGLLAFQGLCRVWEAGSYCKQSNRWEWERGGAYISLIILRRQVPRSSELRWRTESLNRPWSFQDKYVHFLNAGTRNLSWCVTWVTFCCGVYTDTSSFWIYFLVVWWHFCSRISMWIKEKCKGPASPLPLAHLLC